MEGQEHVYCDVISDVATAPSIYTSLQRCNIADHSSNQGYHQKCFSGTQVILMIAVAIFATLSIVFMTLYFTNEAKDNSYQNCSENCNLVSNGSMNKGTNLSHAKQCPVVNVTKYNETVGKSCSDFYKKGVRTDGVYIIDPDGLGAFIVSCDMTTSGGGWTIFQRRIDGSVDFYRGWNEYKKGFGNLNGEFWLGLDKIHRLSKSGQIVLRVDLEDFENNTGYAQYSTFSVANEADKYNLTVEGYSGNAGDALSFHNGMKFSTKDVDNDQWSAGNCALSYKSAWWFNECHRSNLNGRYLRGATSNSEGVTWYQWKGHYYSLKKTEMKIRPRSF